jgi:hypothetical protein
LGVIGKTYEQGSLINVTIELTANKMGWFEFRLCANNEPNKKIEQDCLSLLELADPNENTTPNGKPKENEKYRYYVSKKDMKMFVIKLKLPLNVNCKNCVLQWKYHAGNNYGTSATGESCLGCAIEQEELYNCADVEILPTAATLKTSIDSDNSTYSEITETNLKSASLNNNSILIQFDIKLMFIISFFISFFISI